MRGDIIHPPNSGPLRGIPDDDFARAAFWDALTGLPNRSGLLSQIDRTLEGSGGGTLFRCDLRRLKGVNDTMGQEIGNALLRSVARRLSEASLPQGKVARSGGGEFALFVPRSMNVIEAAHEAEALLALFSAPFPLSDDGPRAPMPVSIAVGVASTADDQDSAERLMANAGRALQRAKAPGAAGYYVHDMTVEEETRLRRLLNDDLRRALDKGEWRLFYQPQVRLTDRKLVGVEALLRWDHPRRGLMTPVDFLPVLQRHTRAAEVGQWLLDEACRQLVAWRRRGVQVPQVAVNLLAIQFNGALAADVGHALERHGLEARDLELEITETIALDQNEPAIGAVRSLAQQGLSISLDDFGTGFASLATLKAIPVTRVKIDRSFVLDLDRSRSSAAVIGAILTLGAQLDLDVVAEGVEQEWQRRALLDLGCRHAQGFLFGAPVSGKLFYRRSTRKGGP